MKSRTCLTCSFFNLEIDTNNLSTTESEEFKSLKVEDFEDMSEDSYLRLQYLIEKMQRRSCTGGLISDNNLRSNCKYYSVLPGEFENGALIQSFGSLRSARSTVKQIISGLIIAIISSLVTFSTLTSKNKKLETEVSELNLKVRQHQTDSVSMISENKILADSIIILNTRINNQKNESTVN